MSGHVAIVRVKEIAIEIYQSSGEVGCGGHEVHEREVDQYLPRLGAYVLDENVGEDDEKSANHGENARDPDNSLDARHHSDGHAAFTVFIAARVMEIQVIAARCGQRSRVAGGQYS